LRAFGEGSRHPRLGWLLLAFGVGAGAAQSWQGPALLRLELRVNRAVYACGEPIELTLAVTNAGPAPVVLVVPSSQLYDFAVLKNDVEVWRWSAGGMFLTVLTPLQIPPGQTREFTESWDQRDRDGRQVGSGDYLVIGILAGGDRVGLNPQRHQITIR
jgi:hypothetical protein